MTEDQIAKLKTDVVDALKEKYFLIPRNAWWAFLGGALAFAVAVGVVSYQSALTAVTEPAVAAAKKSVLDSRDEASSAVAEIKKNLAASMTTEARLSKLEQNAIKTGAKVRLTQPSQGVFSISQPVAITGGSPLTLTPIKPPSSAQNWVIAFP